MIIQQMRYTENQVRRNTTLVWRNIEIALRKICSCHQEKMSLAKKTGRDEHSRLPTLNLLGIRENEIKILSGFLSPFIKIKQTSSSSYFLTWLILKGCYLLSLLHFLAPFKTTDGVGHLENLGLREIVLQRFQIFLARTH